MSSPVPESPATNGETVTTSVPLFAPSPGVALESVLCTDELNRRPSRPPDHASESRALLVLAQHLADSPRTVLQKLADVALEVFQAGSTGISLISKESGDFYWPAIAGAWTPHIGSGTPRYFGPCGIVLDRNAGQLFQHPERYYPYLVPASPVICEVLLSPFSVNGQAVGTVWVVAHDESRRFDAEDLRLLTSLSTFASAAHQALESLDELERERERLRESEAALRQHAAELSEADRRKDEFLATLAHELRNPLAPIRNSLHILRLTGSESGAAGRVHDMVERQVNHMVRLVDDLMEVSRITLRKIELRKEPVELAAVVRSAVETSRPLIEAARHELAITLPAEPLTLEADPVRLAQVVANLLNNAAKYTEEGGRIWLTARREGSNAVVSVRDNGIGIPAGMLPKVFDLFTQVDRTYSRAQGGLGIGLTLVRSLVDLHGGSVEARSDGPGRGSELVVRLPLAGRLDADGGGRRDDRPTAVTSRRILVVDDNRDAANSLGMLLRFLGADVYIAHDGSAALEALRGYQPSVMLLDIGMPEMDGYEVARRARQQPEGRDVTLIALTGWGQEEDRRRSKEAGIDHHLVKPVDCNALMGLLASLSRSE